MVSLVRTDASHSEFEILVNKLDEGLKVTDGDEHEFYHQFNGIENIKYVVIAFDEDQAVGCGAIKHFGEKIMEVKRMFVIENARGKGIASNILAELEKWTRELNYSTCILETGINQPEAVGLYRKSSYQKIENYGQYKDASNSHCFEKVLF